MLKQKIGWIILLFGLVSITAGILFEDILAGIPYQETTPDFTQKYMRYTRFGHLLYGFGISLSLVGLVAFAAKLPQRHAVKTAPYEEDLLNTAMALSLDGGESNPAPVDGRLRALEPGISEDRAKEIDTYIRKAREDIDTIMERFCIEDMNEEEMGKIIKEKYPFLSNDNLNRLRSRGMDYAKRDND